VCIAANNKVGAQSLSAGGQHSLFLCNDSIPRACGMNVSGQLGIGSTFSQKAVPTPVGTLGGVAAVSAGANHSLFLKGDGTVWGCGANLSGQLGDGSTTNRFSPVQIPTLSGIIAISAGNAHSLFLKGDGTVWACGQNNNGKLGDGTTTDKSTPVQLSSLSGITAISAGFGHSLFLKNDSTVWGCGLNLSGPLGTGATSITESTPVQVSTVSAITKISAGAHFSLFLKNNGTIYACGDNDYGQLGDGTVIDRHSPVPINSLSGIADIAAGAGTAYSLFLKNDNTVWVCGVNSGGQFGIGSSSGFNPNSTPVQITALNGIIDISAGQYHSMHLKNDGTAKGSGGNASGQIGNGTFVNTTSLVSVTNMCATAIGIKEVAEKLFFKVYPNPGTGVFFFQTNETGVYINIINLLSEPVYSLQVNTAAAEAIDLSNLPKGIYYLNVHRDGDVRTQKIVIQ